jgi:phosphatidylglycerol:prolipoprotein diacylglycerol transferase
MRPVLFYIPALNLPIYSYGVMLGLSFVVGWYLTLGLCERDGMKNRQTMGSLYVWTAVSAVAGARLLYVVTNLNRFGSIVDLFKFNQGGLVAYGGFIGGFVGAWVFCRKKGLSLLAWADCAVPSLCTGLMLTRIGCYMYGCDFGKPWDGAWSIRFPAGAPAFNQQRMEGLLPQGATHSLPVHPTQFYESLNGALLLGLLFLVRRYRKFSGQMFVAFTMGYAVLRYYVEALRADEQRGRLGPVSTSQGIGIATFSAGLLLLGILYARYRRDPASMRLWERAAAPAGAQPSVPAKNPNAEKRRRKKR